MEEGETMCELCSTDPVILQAAKDNANRMAQRLERAAVIYRGLASGSLKPHTKDFRQKTFLFKAIIRELVEEYI